MTFRKFLIPLLLLIGLTSAIGQPFVHPGGLHTLVDLNRMKTNVLAGNHPWIDDWNVLVADPEAQSNYSSHATSDFAANRQNADADAHAVYLNTIRWYISGDVNFANTATNILNKWSATVTTNSEVGGGLSSLPTMSFALVGELLRAYNGWNPADFSTFTNMMVAYLYQPCSNFISNQPYNFAHWTSWDSPSAAAIIGIGVLTDDTNKFYQAANFFRYGASGTGYGSGAISNAVPFLYGSIGQPEESGRDQEHCTLGIADLGVLCQVAWNQGLDLYGFSSNRLLSAVEYLAQYNMSHSVPYTSLNEFADNHNGDHLFFVSPNGRGRIDDRPVYEMFYNHYAVLQGLSAPNTRAMANLYRPEHGSADHFGYGTLTYTLNSAASPYPPEPLPLPPTGLVARSGISRVILNWTPAQGDLAQGYNVLRSTSSGGPYTIVASWKANTFPSYTDTAVVNGTTYYYVVSAVNQSGVSALSTEVNATPGTSSLPAAWTSLDIGVVTNAGSSLYLNNAFSITGAGTGIGGTGDGGFHYTYVNATNDFTLLARMTDFSADDVGLMMCAALTTNAAEAQFNLGANGRESTYAIRSSTSANLNHYSSGDQFTYTPTWYKLVRSGSTVTAYQSDDGVNWITAQSSTPSFGSTYYAGIDINNGTAYFDNVFFTNAAVANGNIAPPSAPATLAAMAVASNQINLSWSAVSNAVSYHVKRSIVNGSGYTLIASNVASVAFFDTTAAANTTYYYVVTAVNGGGESTNSPQASATTSGIATPAAPASLTAVPNASEVVLQWPAAAGAASYNVKRSPIAGGPYTNIATGLISSFTDPTVIGGQRYFYVVTAVNSAGESTYSPEANALVLPALKAYLKFDETGGTVAFDSTSNNWNGSLLNGPAFAAGYSNNAVNLVSNNTQCVTLPAGVMSGLSNFTISAWVKQTTVSPWSRIFDFGTGTGVYMFLTPMNGANNVLRFAITTASTGGEQQINGTSILPTGLWEHVAVTLHGPVGILYVNGVPVGTNSSMTLNPAALGVTTQNYIGKSQWNDPYLNGSVDEFRIYDDALSANDVATLVSALPAPANLAATAGDGTVSLTWNAVTRAASYNVSRSLTSGGPFTLVTSLATTNFINTGLSDGTNYYYVVTALNAAGESAPSSQASARPVSTTPTSLNLAASSGQLQFNWPADHIGWRLQVQTNALNSGLGTNWATVTGSILTNQISLPITPDNSTVFFRLTYP